MNKKWYDVGELFDIEKDMPWYIKEMKPYKPNDQRVWTKIKVKLCPECNDCWEYDRYSRERIFVYDEFPKYKLKKETCVRCK